MGQPADIVLPDWQSCGMLRDSNRGARFDLPLPPRSDNRDVAHEMLLALGRLPLGLDARVARAALWPKLILLRLYFWYAEQGVSTV